ncbi:ATP-binding protein [Variovorax paradoxus]|uniref:ATP-binding protein n=1 Tax=Variovorax paradoxus TaxID=34073 RepID=UPI00278909E6|nr:ATP-binding protein [Variovorax paradoxus]MDP9927932.1 signal transduction histidine kinase [Variovorax paradoxus]
MKAHDFSCDVATGAAAAIGEILASVRQERAGIEDAQGDFLRSSVPAMARRGDMLAAELLSFAGRQDLKPERVQVLPFLCDFADRLRHTVDVKINVVIEVDRECLPWTIDADALRDALIQLVSNSVRAMPEGGRLILRAAPDRGESSEGTILSVIDNGSGMTADVLSMAKRPFFTTKTHSSMSGMGLPAVAGFVAQSCGTLSLISAPGRGTSAALLLPTASISEEISGRASGQDEVVGHCRRSLTAASLMETAERRSEALPEDAASAKLLSHNLPTADPGGRSPGRFSTSSVCQEEGMDRPSPRILTPST